MPTISNLLDLGRLIVLALGAVLLLYLIFAQWRFHREYAHLYLKRDFWRYGHGDALNERHRIVELLLIAAAAQEHYGLGREARAYENAARLAAEPHLIDILIAPDTVLPFWLADYMRDHRARAAIFGRREEVHSEA
jgi:hypothetical protein